MFVFFHVRNKKNHLVSRTFFSPLIKYFSTQFHTRTQNLLKKCSHWVSQIKICVSPDFFFFPQVFTAIKRTYQLIQEKTFFHQFSSHKHKSVNASVLFSLFSEMTKKILRGKKNYLDHRKKIPTCCSGFLSGFIWVLVRGKINQYKQGMRIYVYRFVQENVFHLSCCTDHLMTPQIYAVTHWRRSTPRLATTI